HMSEYLPVMGSARYLESRFGIRTVMAYNEDYDGRPTVVTRHGFGCWSVLGGKITTCVSNAREIVTEMFPQSAESNSPERKAAPATVSAMATSTGLHPTFAFAAREF